MLLVCERYDSKHSQGTDQYHSEDLENAFMFETSEAREFGTWIAALDDERIHADRVMRLRAVSGEGVETRARVS